MPDVRLLALSSALRRAQATKPAATSTATKCLNFTGELSCGLKPAVVQREHSVRRLQRFYPVCKDDRCGSKRPEAVQHASLGAEVQVAGGFVEHQQFRFAEERAGQQDALALPTRKRKLSEGNHWSPHKHASEPPATSPQRVSLRHPFSKALWRRGPTGRGPATRPAHFDSEARTD